MKENLSTITFQPSAAYGSHYSRELSLLFGSFLLFFVIAEVGLFGLELSLVELRENGLVQSDVFIPWDRVQTYRWEEGEIPTLVLQFGKQAFKRYGVAAGQRDMIDECLREHLRDATSVPPPHASTSPGQPSADA